MNSLKTPSHIDKKHKQAEMGGDCDATPSMEDPQLDFLPKMVRFLEEMRERDERGETAVNHRQEILRAKEQVNQVQEMKRALDEYTASVHSLLMVKQEERIRGLFDSTSPLLSLGKPILSHLIGYLDEEALLSLEEASTTVKQYYVSTAVDELHDRRKQQGIGSYFPIPLKKKKIKPLSREPTPLERAQAFAKAARFARNMETLAARHYNYDQQEKEKPKLKEEVDEASSNYPSIGTEKKQEMCYEDMQIHCSGCEALDHMSCPSEVFLDYGKGSDSVFVRLSYRTTPEERSPLIWEGFVHHKKLGRLQERGYEYLDESQRITINMGAFVGAMKWPEMKHYMTLLDTDAFDSNEDKASQLEQIATNLQVSVVLVPDVHGLESYRQTRRLDSQDAPCGKGAYLFVSTGGFDRYSYGTVYLKPRNKRMHETTWDRNNFLRTSLDIEKGNNFHLSIDDDNPFETTSRMLDDYYEMVDY